MTKYHLKENGEPGVCNAGPGRCPKKDSDGNEPKHFATKDDARTHQEQLHSKALNKTLRKTKDFSEIEPLNETPEWVNKITEEHHQKGSSLEPLGKFTHNGETFTALYTPRSIRKQDIFVQEDSGFTISRYTLHDSKGVEVGYLNVAEMSDEALENSFGNDEYRGFRYMSRYSGASYGNLYHYDKETNSDTIRFPQSDEEKREFKNELWLNTVRNQELVLRSKNHNISIPVASRHLDESHVPDPEQVDRDLQVIHSTALKEMQKAQNYHKTPSVDYSNISDKYRGTGIGSRLYQITAKDLGTQNKVLRGSGIQSDSAQTLWKTIREKGAPVKVIKLPNPSTQDSEEFHVLDYRGHASKV